MSDLVGNPKDRFSRNSSFISVFQIHIGVKGSIIDDETGLGIEGAIVSVATINKNITTDQFGYYWRLLTAGSYTLSFHKEG